MDIADRIRSIGLQRWYERQLVESHLALTVCLLAGLAAAAFLEAFLASDFGWRPVLHMVAFAVAFAVGWVAWRRYVDVFTRAQHYSSRATCPNCRVYARFEVLATGHPVEGPYRDPSVRPLPCPWLRVRCRECRTEWRIPE